MSARELDGPLWQRTNRGLWAFAPGEDPSPAGRILRATPLVRGGGAIGGWAAAWVLGARTLDGQSPAGEPVPVLVCLPRHARCRRTCDVRVFRSELSDGEVSVVDGVPVTSAVRTCVDLARLGASTEEAVVGVDALRAGCVVDLEAATVWLDEHRRWTGVRQARVVLARSQPGVRSPQETRLRLLWTLDAQLPEPRVNARVLHQDGRLLCEADLLDPGSGLVAEYDGAHHADAAQRTVDHTRRDAMRRAGLTVVVVAAPGLASERARTVHRLRSAWSTAQTRDRTRDTWYLP